MATLDLASGEEVVVRTRLHPMVFSGAVTFAASVLAIVALIIHRNDLPPATVRQMWLVGAGLALLGFVGPFLRWRAAEFVVTPRRFVIRGGLFTVHTLDIPLARLQSIEVVGRRLAGRLLGYGTLRIVGPRGTETFVRVARPEVLRDAVLRQTPRSPAARAR